jgi:hypothetical protein
LPSFKAIKKSGQYRLSSSHDTEKQEAAKSRVFVFPHRGKGSDIHSFDKPFSLLLPDLYKYHMDCAKAG